jgi:hypothetical protein
VIDRRALVKAALVAGAGALATACNGGEGGTGGPAPAPVAKLTADPPVDAKSVPVRQPVTLRVTGGSLTDVKVTNAAGNARLVGWQAWTAKSAR